MANHSYVHPSRNLTATEAEECLKKAVASMLEGKMVVEKYDSTEAELTWHVHLPGSELAEDAPDRPSKFMKAPGETFGFVVWFHTRKAYWEFRHPPNNWERWAQDKVQQTIARNLGIPTFEDDSTDDPQKVDPDELRDTYYQYITRNFKPPHNADDRKWFEHCLAVAPEGFRT